MVEAGLLLVVGVLEQEKLDILPDYFNERYIVQLLKDRLPGRHLLEYLVLEAWRFALEQLSRFFLVRRILEDLLLQLSCFLRSELLKVCKFR